MTAYSATTQAAIDGLPSGRMPMSERRHVVSNITERGGRPLDEEALVAFSACLNGREFFFSTYSKLAELRPESPYYDLEVSQIGKKGLRDPTLIKFTSDEMAAIRHAIVSYFGEHGQSPDLKPPRKIKFI